MSDKEFPAWYFGPDGQSKIINSFEEIPEGWAESPNQVKVANVEGQAKPESRPRKAKADPKEVKPKKDPETKADESTDEPLTMEVISEKLSGESMSALWKMCKDLGIDKSGKKPEVIKRIAEKIIEIQ